MEIPCRRDGGKYFIVVHAPTDLQALGDGGGWKVWTGPELRKDFPWKGPEFGAVPPPFSGRGWLLRPRKGTRLCGFCIWMGFYTFGVFGSFNFLCVWMGACAIISVCVLFLEKAPGEGGQKKEAGSEVYARLHPPRRRWNHGRCQLCKLCP